MQVRLEGANNTQIGFSNGIAVVGVKDGITEDEDTENLMIWILYLCHPTFLTVR